MLKGQYRFVASNKLPLSLDQQEPVNLSSDDLHKLKSVLRVKTDQAINVICQLTGKIFLAKITKLNPEIEIKLQSQVEAEVTHTKVKKLIVALCKGEKNDFICQKATELGVEEIHFTQCQRSIVKITPSDFHKKLDRWNKIAKAATQQSGQILLPKINFSTNLSEAINQNIEQQQLLFCHMNGSDILTCELTSAVNLVIGPEGGLSEQELELLENNQGKCLSLGPTTLRAETAAILALGILNLRLASIQ